MCGLADKNIVIVIVTFLALLRGIYIAVAQYLTNFLLKTLAASKFVKQAAFLSSFRHSSGTVTSNFSPLICVFLCTIQTYTAVYYVFADLLMLGMYSYYKMKNRRTQSECFSVLLMCYLFYGRSDFVTLTSL